MLSGLTRTRRSWALCALLVLAACLWMGISTESSRAKLACVLAGVWNQTTDQVGSTAWDIDPDGTATETNGGDATGKGTLSGNVLTITWTNPSGSYAGVYRWELDAHCKSTTGKLHFTKKDPGDSRQDLDSSVTGPPPREVPDFKVIKASFWGRPAPTVEVEPGDATLVRSPRLGRRQRTAKITLSFPLCGRQEHVCTEPDKWEAALAPLNRRTRLENCIWLYEINREATESMIYSTHLPQSWFSPTRVKVTHGDDTVAFLAMSACLEAFRALDAKERPSARAAATGDGCGSFSYRLALNANRRNGTAKWKAKSAAKAGQSGPLKVSCTYGAGGMTMRVQPRARRATLRSVVGSNLVVGIHRASDSSGAGRVQPTFGRGS